MASKKNRKKEALALFVLIMLVGMFTMFLGIERIISDTGFWFRNVGRTGGGLFLIGFGAVFFCKELKKNPRNS